MYGLFVVELEIGLEPVDRELYVVQGDFYSSQPRGTHGHLGQDGQLMRDERPSFVVFNGKVASLTGDNAMQAKAGERVLIFIGNAEPNLLSAFDVIGEVFDRMHQEGASTAASNIQTTVVPAGGPAWVELIVEVPGTYILVDHSLSRALDKGAVDRIVVTSEANPAIFDVPAGQQMSSRYSAPMITTS
jgi:nitrite reductase (NO-forming)